MKQFRLGLIYKITNKINKKAYVGCTLIARGMSSKEARQARWHEHILAARHGSQCAVHRAIRKYGENGFIVRTLKIVTEPLLFAAEIDRIAKHDTFKHGYNMTAGGDGVTMTIAVRGKISRAVRNAFASNPGLAEAISNRRLGVPLSLEARAKISAIQLGKKQRPEVTEKIRQANLGAKRSAVGRANISAAMLGRRASDEARASLRAAWVRRKAKGLGVASDTTKKKMSAGIRAAWVVRRAEGRASMSDATKAKISAIQLGQKRKPLSEAHKHKLSAAAKRREERRRKSASIENQKAD